MTVLKGEREAGPSAAPQDDNSSSCRDLALALLCGSAADDLAVFHDEGDALEGADIGERVALHGDHVGVEAGLELADGVGPVEQLGAVDEVGVEGFGGGHAVLDHQFELTGLGSVGEGADVGADREGNAGGELLFELGGVIVEIGLRP